MTKLLVVFLNFAKAPKMYKASCLYIYVVRPVNLQTFSIENLSRVFLRTRRGGVGMGVGSRDRLSLSMFFVIPAM
jgi:hypothetical protein